MPLLLSACPSFAERWKEHRAYYGEEELLYIDLGEFAGHLIDLYKQDQKQEFPAVFCTVENLHIEGDEYVREAATIGLLEGMQNIAGNRGVGPDVFEQYLKPESKKWWGKLNDFWNGDAGKQKT
ncbi:MAG: hypothetical protein ABIU20_09700 [Blastocatellia bacterium]